jgi:hypothetical protein
VVDSAFYARQPCYVSHCFKTAYAYWGPLTLFRQQVRFGSMIAIAFPREGLKPGVAFLAVACAVRTRHAARQGKVFPNVRFTSWQLIQGSRAAYRMLQRPGTAGDNLRPCLER